MKSRKARADEPLKERPFSFVLWHFMIKTTWKLDIVICGVFCGVDYNIPEGHVNDYRTGKISVDLHFLSLIFTACESDND